MPFPLKSVLSLFPSHFYFRKLCCSLLTQAIKTYSSFYNDGSVLFPVYHSPLSLYNPSILALFIFSNSQSVYWFRNSAYTISSTWNILFFQIFYLFIFRVIGRETSMWERNIDCLWYMTWPGTKPTTQACALSGNQTGELLPCGMMSNQLSHIGQGWEHSFYSLLEMAIEWLWRW